MNKVTKEINRLIEAKFSVLNKWETKRQEVQKVIDDLEEKLSLPEIEEDYEAFMKISNQIKENKFYLERIEEKISKESVTSEEEKKILDEMQKKVISECESIKNNLTAEINKAGKKLLPLYDSAITETNELETAMRDLSRVFNSGILYGLDGALKPYKPESDIVHSRIRNGLIQLKDRK